MAATMLSGALVCFAAYAWYSLSPQFRMSPVERLQLLCFACLLAYFGSFLIARTAQNAKKQKIMKITFGVLFAAYLILIVTFTLFDIYFSRSGLSSLSDIDAADYYTYVKHSVNFVPFKTIRLYLRQIDARQLSLQNVITNLLGNLIAFAPFALFLPLLFQKMRSFWTFFAAMVCIVIFVELLQFALLTGSCDIDDFILNISGVSLCYGLLHIRRVRIIVNKITMLTY